MNAPGKIVLYFIVVLFLGALTAPPLFRGVHSLKESAEARGWITYEVREKPLKKGDRPPEAGTPREMETKTRGPARWLDASFAKVANRATLIAALALLWPLMRSLRLRGACELGIDPNPHRIRDFAIGYSVSVCVMFILAVVLLKIGVFTLRASPSWSELGWVVLSGLGAGFLEEWIFRGAFLGSFRRSLRPWSALAAVSAIFAFVHFINPREAMEPASIGWGSGFAMLPQRFQNFSEPSLVFGGFVTLFCFGWVCGWAVIRTRSLWLGIGFHAGMVLGKFGLNRVAERADQRSLLPWLGEDMTVGLLGTGVVILIGGLLWLIFKYVAPPSCEKPVERS